MPVPYPRRLWRLVLCAAFTVLLALPCAPAALAGPAPGGPVAGGWLLGPGLGSNELFVGQHRNSAGQWGYCTDFERLAPALAGGYSDGSSGPFVRSNGSPLTEAENGTLSYLLMRWGPTSDPQTAAAVQLAVWALTSSDRSWGTPGMAAILAMATLPASTVALGQQLSAQATALAGPYTLRVSFTRGDAAAVSVQSAAGNPVPDLALGATASGSVAFSPGPDGSVPAGRQWSSGEGPEYLPVHRTSLAPGSVDVTAEQVPRAAVAWFMPARADAQRLLVSPITGTLSGTAAVEDTAPFQPTVTTVASAAPAGAGAMLHDELTVGSADPRGWLSDPGTGRAVSVDVVSSLWGPLPAAPAERATVPEGTALVGTVSTTVSGQGTYTTPGLAVQAPGHYVWTEAIAPQSAVPASAAPYLLGWQGRFGVATETSLVKWQPSVSTHLGADSPSAGASATDAITVSGLPPATTAELTLTLYGPLAERPQEQPAVPAGVPQAAVQKIHAGNGPVDSAAIPALPAGCYTAVVSVAAGAEHLEFTSPYGLASETLCLLDAPAPEQTAPAALRLMGQPAAAVPQLAQTGPAQWQLGAIAVGILGTGMACGIMTWRQRRL